MQLHELKRKTKNIKKAKVGRGGKRGKTSGKGHKGQKARSGHRIRPEIRDMIKKIPKLRGRGKNINKAFDVANAVVSFSQIEANFKAGDRVSPQVLFEKDLIKKVSGKLPSVKILNKGELKNKFEFKNCLVSEAALAEILKVGGKVL